MEEIAGARRSWFLIALVALTNIYLTVFAADGVLSVIDDALQTAGLAGIGGARDAVAGIAQLLTLPALFLTFFVPQIPKTALLPSIVFQYWLALGAPFLPVDADNGHLTSLFASLVQTGIAFGTFAINRARYGTWYLQTGALPHKGSMVIRTIVALVAAIVILPVAFATMLVSAFVQYTETETAGYMDFTWSGIDLRETVLQKDGKTVRLVAMVHIGDPQFYIDLFQSIPENALVLAEGVTDEKNLLKKSLSYENAAQTLGLESQNVFSALLGPPGGEKPAPASPDKPPAAAAPEPQKQPGRPTVVYADVDVSAFEPKTLDFIRAITEVYASRTTAEAVRRLGVLQTMSDEDVEAVMADILEKRNAQLLSEFDKRAAPFPTVVVPWGAAHMPGLEAALIERGYKVADMRVRRVASFSDMIARIMNAWRASSAQEHGRNPG